MKQGLQVFNICFMFNNSTMKSKSNSRGPQERCYTEEMCAVALSNAKESFGRIPAYNKSFLCTRN